MKYCFKCGIPDWDNDFKDGYCRECYLRQKRDKHQEDKVKKKTKNRKHDLEEVCKNITSMGMSYAEYQKLETLGKIKKE